MGIKTLAVRCFEVREKTEGKHPKRHWRSSVIGIVLRLLGSPAPAPPFCHTSHAIALRFLNVCRKPDNEPHSNLVRKDIMIWVLWFSQPSLSKPAWMEPGGRGGTGRKYTASPYGSSQTPALLSFRQGGLAELDVIPRVPLELKKTRIFFWKQSTISSWEPLQPQCVERDRIKC